MVMGYTNTFPRMSAMWFCFWDLVLPAVFALGSEKLTLCQPFPLGSTRTALVRLWNASGKSDLREEHLDDGKGTLAFPSLATSG